MIRRSILAAFAAFFLAAPAQAQTSPRDQRVIFVMLDGLRWQEVFRGADTDLAASTEYMRSSFAKDVRAGFVDVSNRREALMPFLTGVVARDGALIGNRDAGSCAHVTNDRWFSYPGYNETLTGKPDARVNSNDYGPNPNVTFLEWLNRQPGYASEVAAATSWDAFTRIINAERSGVPVNAGLMPLRGSDGAVTTYNRLLADTPVPWKSVRLDAFTHMAAMHTLRTQRPRVMFISYDETDDFAHDGDYAQYLMAAHRTDGFLRELWETVQRDRAYAGRTTLLITVDHGRGDQPGESWRHHYSGPALAAGTSPLREKFPNGIPGSDQTWIGALGPRVRAGETLAAQAGDCAGSNQMAATTLTALGLDWRAFDATAGAPLGIFK
ncbi:MAG: alkaline phosphatase family protein [Hyphomonadaceae bacterium]|nr:MAG: hypothetical protein FD160_177 [Caulobacteraceae bacterium]MBT9445191.1 alkaline phosphatase family protein [Hyphomonadaceae bacterium]TPW02532.1 MAG: hypothetical protein FD124_3368 [Alphaproteobacteria bacterium]